MLALTIILLVPQDFDQLARDLASESAEVRDRATEALTEAGAGSVPSLLPLVDSNDREVSARVRAIIRRIGFPALGAMEESRSSVVRKLADSLISDKGWRRSVLVVS